MEKESVGCFIICKDEADNIGRALDSVAELDEVVVVVDAGSSDGTADIARARGARVLRREWAGFSAQKQFALTQARARWVLNLDADEEASAELVAELRAFAEAGRGAGLKIPRRERQFGKWQSAGTRRNALVRFFRRDLARYGDHAVHEEVIVDGEVLRARNVIFHRGERTIADKVAKINLYSSLRAEERRAKGRRGSRLKLALAFPFAFFRSLILRRAFLDGWRGFANAAANGFYALLKEAKLLELSDPPDGDEAPGK